MKISTMKGFLAGICCALVCIWSAGSAGAAEKGTYKKVDDALNERIRADVAAHFATGETGAASLFKEFCICMPAYWEAIKALPGARFLHGKTTTLNTPAGGGRMVEAAAMELKDAMDLRVLARQFSADAGKTPVIRKLTQEEIDTLVQVLPIEMEEPIFMLENGERKFVVLMGEDDSRNGKYFIVFVDEFSRYKK